MAGEEGIYSAEVLGGYPVFDIDDFSMWKSRTLDFMTLQDYDMREAVDNGPYVPFDRLAAASEAGKSSVRNKPLAEWTDEDKRRANADARARWYICNALPDDVYHCVDDCCTAKEMIEALGIVCEGGEEVKEVKKQQLIRDYELFVAYNGETLTQTYDRFNCLVNDLTEANIEKSDYELVNKFMDSLPVQWVPMISVLRYGGKIKTLTLHSLYDSLRSHELLKTQKKSNMAGEEYKFPAEVVGWYPVFDWKNFSLWKRRFLLFLNAQSYDMREVIANGPYEPVNQLTNEEERRAKLDAKAKWYIINALPDDVIHFIKRCCTAKEMLEALSVVYEGPEEVKEAKNRQLIRDYELFVAYNGETLAQTYIRFKGLVNDLRRANVEKSDYELVKKFMGSLPDQWEVMKTVLRYNGRMKTLTLVGLYDILLSHELLETQKKIAMKDGVDSANKRSTMVSSSSEEVRRAVKNLAL